MADLKADLNALKRMRDTGRPSIPVQGFFFLIVVTRRVYFTLPLPSTCPAWAN